MKYIAVLAVAFLLLLIEIMVSIPLMTGIHTMWPTFSTFEHVVMFSVFTSVQLAGGIVLGLTIAGAIERGKNVDS